MTWWVVATRCILRILTPMPLSPASPIRSISLCCGGGSFQVYWALPNLVVLPVVLRASGTAHSHFCLVNGSALSHLAHPVVPQSGETCIKVCALSPNTLLSYPAADCSLCMTECAMSQQDVEGVAPFAFMRGAVLGPSPVVARPLGRSFVWVLGDTFPDEVCHHFGAFLLWPEVGASKCIGHCPITWFSQPFWGQQCCW